MIKKIALATCCLLPLSVQADVRINGFASVKAGMTLDSDETLYGYEDEINFENESLGALQITADLAEDISATVQLVGRGKSDYDAKFEWAYISFQLDDNLKLNAGRLTNPFYKYTDYLDVGYAYDWIRVPQAVYGLNFNNLDGVSLYHTSDLGFADSTLQVSLGTNTGKPVVGGMQVDGTMKNGYSLVWELAIPHFSVRLAHLGGKFSTDIPELKGLSNILLEQGFVQAADGVVLDDESGSFSGIAITFDKNDWIIIGEITKAEMTDSIVADQNGYYVSVGHRFGKFTPVISFEKRDNEAKSFYLDEIPEESPFYTAVLGAVNTFEIESDVWNVGLRYDFHPSAAFKVQFTDSNIKTTDEKAQLLSFGVDLVF